MNDCEATLRDVRIIVRKGPLAAPGRSAFKQGIVQLRGKSRYSPGNLIDFTVKISLDDDLVKEQLEKSSDV